MPQWNDVARTSPPPGWFDPAVEPCDKRVFDSAYSNPPAGGFHIPGGSSPEKLVACAIGTTPTDPAGAITTAVGSDIDDPAVLTIGGSWLAGSSAEVTYTTSVSGPHTLLVTAVNDMNAHGMAELIAYDFNMYEDELSALSMEGLVHIYMPESGTVTINDLVVAGAP